jgi:hypothetical protein
VRRIHHFFMDKLVIFCINVKHMDLWFLHWVLSKAIHLYNTGFRFHPVQATSSISSPKSFGHKTAKIPGHFISSGSRKSFEIKSHSFRAVTSRFASAFSPPNPQRLVGEKIPLANVLTAQLRMVDISKLSF